MKLSQRLKSVRRVFVDTAPIIYFVESNPRYRAQVDVFFDQLDRAVFRGVVSPIMLAECLVVPHRSGATQLFQAFRELLLSGDTIQFQPTDSQIAEKAAELRSRSNLTLTDAIQIATAILTGCDAIFTNDIHFKRVSEVEALVLDEFEPE
ncbi:MAG: PIN domain-containing protein [Anaerolineales bacterium]|nr:PIN domain-containing protein [Anaerolineales bacterium]